MASRILNNLIRYIISEVQDAEGEILRTRLVKLLYLCDIEYYRSTRETLTGLNWIRYKFGPYAFELPEITRRMGMDIGEEEFDFSTMHGIKYEAYEYPNPDTWLRTNQKFIIDRVIKRWGNEELQFLLDYVYCDTEPMINADFRASLNFKKITRGMRRASADKLDLALSDIESVKKLIDKYGTISRKPIALSVQKKMENGDESHSPNIVGKANQKSEVIRMFEGRE